ncbi:MAG: serine/threonine protein kinase [Labilithrix sp.]|nr:serine/threonine protein kinase [Labilithrix sp.]
MAVNPGDILGQKYRVDALIGRGGMGHVFAATDLTGPAPPVAIKVVSRVVFDETLMVRLRREAEAAARIRSDYVPRVLEVSDTDEREMYLVMERLVGEALSQRMNAKGALPWDEVVQIGEDVLRGLIDAHTAGVVHRDLKPSNVFLAQKGGRVRAMVLDFGVCKLDGTDAERLTGTGESIGTVAYMAPEQIRGASKVDDRADLYAFGVLVFEMITGNLPHDGPSQMAILASKLENAPVRLADCARVAVPAGLDELVSKCLVREPKLRFASAQELLKAWKKLGPADAGTMAALAAADGAARSIHDAPTEVGRPGDRPDTTVRGAAEPMPTEVPTALTGITLRKGKGGRAAFALAGAALIAGVIGVIAAVARGPESAIANVNVNASVASVGADASVDDASAPAALASAEPDEEIIELADPGPGPGPTAAPVAGKKPPVRGKPGGQGKAAPKASGPHITSQPRY